MRKPQQSLCHHYVPEWYQKRFLAPGKTAFKILDLKPTEYRHPKTGALVGRAKSLHEAGPNAWFYEEDLYSVRAFGEKNDAIERYLFGAIDTAGKIGLEAVVEENFNVMHEYYSRFLEYVGAQRLRTPRGLRFIQALTRSVTQEERMGALDFLRTIYCVMLGESAREIFSAHDSPVKFIFSDNPVTFYNAHVFPADGTIKPGMDPPMEWQATQTIFPLDRNRVAVFTHKEWARNSVKRNARVDRTNARLFDNPMIWYHDWERKRTLDATQVRAVNYILKARAERYIAGDTVEDLYPERHLRTKVWDRLAPFLLPNGFHLGAQDGYTVVGLKDGSFYFQDEHGRRPATQAEYDQQVMKAKADRIQIEKILAAHHEKERAKSPAQPDVRASKPSERL